MVSVFLWCSYHYWSRVVWQVVCFEPWDDFDAGLFRWNNIHVIPRIYDFDLLHRYYHFISFLCIGCIVVCLKGTFIANLSLNLLITLTTGMKPHLKFRGIHWIWGWVDIVFVQDVYIDIPNSSRYAQVKNPVFGMFVSLLFVQQLSLQLFCTVGLGISLVLSVKTVATYQTKSISTCHWTLTTYGKMKVLSPKKYGWNNPYKREETWGFSGWSGS